MLRSKNISSENLHDSYLFIMTFLNTLLDIIGPSLSKKISLTKNDFVEFHYLHSMYIKPVALTENEANVI